MSEVGWKVKRNMICANDDISCIKNVWSPSNGVGKPDVIDRLALLTGKAYRKDNTEYDFALSNAIKNHTN